LFECLPGGSAMNTFHKVISTLTFLLAAVAFSQAASTWTTIDVPGAVWTVAAGINNNGQIAGSFEDGNFAVHGFVYTTGTFTTIDVPGGGVTAALGINDSAEIVGNYSDST